MAKLEAGIILTAIGPEAGTDDKFIVGDTKNISVQAISSDNDTIKFSILFEIDSSKLFKESFEEIKDPAGKKLIYAKFDPDNLTNLLLTSPGILMDVIGKVGDTSFDLVFTVKGGGGKVGGGAGPE